MYPGPLLSQSLKEAHQQALQTITEPGPSWTGDERVAMVAEARSSLDCGLCQRRKSALTPAAHTGNHDGPAILEPVVVDAIHRIRTDPARLTRNLFDSVTEHISPAAWVEMVSVVNTSVIIDTLHDSLGLALPELPAAEPGDPTGDPPGDTVEAGAWVPIMAAPEDMADTGLPGVPNIFRAMGLVPQAVNLFFGAFRPHYALKDIDLSISQAQAEFVASRVSAMNECFY